MSADVDLGPLWAATLAIKRQITGDATAPIDGEDQTAILAATIGRWTPKPQAKGPLTLNVALELIDHEAIVLEWYRDSKGIGTWSVGITNASGHNVDRYRDQPQTVQRCLEVFLWVLNERYVPMVARAFRGFALTEARFAAALSFHYNTGAIGSADWVAQFKAGEIEKARESFMNWRKPPEVIPRREKERDLFFDGKWSNTGMATIYPVLKPAYRPDFRRPQLVDVRPALESLLG